MELLSQQDKKWKGEKLGKSKWTIGNAGCVITSLCNCHNLAGNNITPIDYYREQIEYYETTCKKMKRLSNFGFWCGIASLVFVTVSMILKAVL